MSKKFPKESRLGGYRLTTEIAPEWALTEPDKYAKQIAQGGAIWCAFWGGIATFWCFGLGAVSAYRWGYQHCLREATHEIENLIDYVAERKLAAETEQKKAEAKAAREKAQQVKVQTQAMKQDPLFQALKALGYSVAEATGAYDGTPLEGETGERLAFALHLLAKPTA